MNIIRYFVLVERYEPHSGSILFKPHFEKMAVSEDQAEEQFGKHLSHLIDAYGGVCIWRDTLLVPNTNKYMKSYTLVKKGKDVASVILIPVLIDSDVVVKELEQGDL